MTQVANYIYYVTYYKDSSMSKEADGEKGGRLL